MTASCEMGVILIQAVGICVKVLSRHSTGRTDENQEKSVQAVFTFLCIGPRFK